MEEQMNLSPEPYHLYTDPALLEAAQGDHHFGLLLEGLQKAEEIATKRSDDPTFRYVAIAAEEGVRSWIARKGYSTQESAEEPRP